MWMRVLSFFCCFSHCHTFAPALFRASMYYHYSLCQHQRIQYLLFLSFALTFLSLWPAFPFSISIQLSVWIAWWLLFPSLAENLLVFIVIINFNPLLRWILLLLFLELMLMPMPFCRSPSCRRHIVWLFNQENANNPCTRRDKKKVKNLLSILIVIEMMVEFNGEPHWVFVVVFYPHRGRPQSMNRLFVICVVQESFCLLSPSCWSQASNGNNNQCFVVSIGRWNCTRHI